ncbi:MAG: GGDEF domain-containing protein [Desulforegulaceae bacterium]|nr:GGDEF domain-containing protein [Desulforegulaceae bacterium]
MTTKNKSFLTGIIKNQKNIHDLENFCLSFDKKKLKSYIFPKKIKLLYTNFSFKADKIKNIVFLLIGSFFYALFALMDILMINDIYIFAWKLRFFILFPIIIFCIFIIHKSKKTLTMDIAIIFSLLIGISSILLMVNTSNYYLAPQYHSGIFLICIAGLLIFKISLIGKLIFSLITIITTLIFFYFNQNLDFYSKFNIICVLTSLAAVAFVSAVEKEMSSRKSFIHFISQEITTLNLEEKTKFLGILSNQDELTGLANRRFLKKHLQRLYAQTGNGIFPVSVLYADLDNFKSYNDNYGHDAGDICLKKTAEVLKKYTKRKFDLASRWGGEEFLIVLPFTTLEEAFYIGEKIRTGIENLKIENKFSKTSNKITISIGVAFSEKSESNFDNIIKKADKALYIAKNSGKNMLVAG